MTCLHEILEAQVEERPTATALIHGEAQLTYRELEERANRLARHLRAHGAAPGRLVGLYLERSEKPIVAILAILKAGAAYVPLDPAFPEERIGHILADAEVKVLVTEASLAGKAAAYSEARRIVLDDPEEQREIDRQPATRLDPSESGVSPEDLSYIIYTSGTTGRPKGILTEHHNVVEFTRSFAGVCALEPTDRVYQGFSLGFDGSVEEMWLAFSAGATLVVGPPEVAGLGDETARFMVEHGVTVFSTVPTFLTMFREDVPSLRLVILSGESCPPELVKTWVRDGRRMLNVYGPTETTVNTTAWECVPDVPVTIGRPLPGYTTFILDEKRRPVPPGEAGELYIGGIGVARGYLNQPELTERHFITDPFDGNGTSSRLYRTGDLVSQADDGDLLFHGRIDGQVKVRGYRIELGEIECVLREHPAVEAAVVTVVERKGLRELAAYVVPATDVETGLPRGELLDLLRQRLPAYMIPVFLDELEVLPRLVSGKVDRKALPAPIGRLLAAEREIVPPETETERIIAEAWQEVFQLAAISIDENFFLDLGGDSLLAVEASILLRKTLREDMAVRELYRFPTVRRLAEYVACVAADESHRPEPADRPTAQEVFAAQPRWTRWLCVTLQALSLLVLYGLPMMVLVGMGELYFGVEEGTVALSTAVLVLVALLIGGYPLLLCLGLLIKWTVIGKYRAGSYPLWGLYYFRWWLATRVQRMSAAGLLAGTPLLNIYYRLMGARVGRGCVIYTAHCSCFDLVTIGDGTSIGNESQLLGYRVADGMLTIGSIDLGADCYVGIQSALGIDTAMGDRARLDDLSLLADGDALEPDEHRHGSPSQRGAVPVPEIPEGAVRRHRSFLIGALSILGVYAVQLFMLAAPLPSLALLYFAYTVGSYWLWGLVLFAAIPLFELCFWGLHILVKALVLHRARPGVYPIDSAYFLRKWFVDSLLSLSRLVTLPIYTTLYLPPLLRRLGAKIGARAELSVIVGLSPDLVVMEEESFFADGSIIGGVRCHLGHFELARNRIGRRSFIGNSAILPVGSEVGRGSLLGVLSSPPRDGGSVPDGTEWLGSPPFALPHRKKVEGFTESETYQPPTRLFVARLFVDALRIATPSVIEIIGVIALAIFIVWTHGNLTLPVTLALAPLASLVIVWLEVLCVVLVKRGLFETYEPVIKPLWSPYVWFNEVVNGVHESVAAPALTPMLGTPFFAPYLRLMGCKVGKHVYLETTLFGEFDLVEICDHAQLNHDVVVQNHLFEDRIFKSSHLVIGDNCHAGNMSVILYDSRMGAGSSIGSLSLLMKGESLPPETHWEGIPVRKKPCSHRSSRA